MIVKIDGVQIKSPHHLKPGIYRISDAGRVASGEMKMDVIAIKRKIELIWKVISGKHLKQILDLLETSAFHQVEYPDPQTPGTLTTKTMYVGDIPIDDLVRSDGSYYWKDVRIALIEK